MKGVAMEIIDGIPVWGTEIDQAALKQIKTCYYMFGKADDGGPP